MNYILDTHTHTIFGGHAYSTWLENVEWASKNGIEVLGTTEHGPAMPGGPHIFYFENLKVLPREVFGVIHLRGCEANIIDYDGTLDIPESTQQKLDIIIASLHEPCIKPGTIEENTRTLLKVMDNPFVDILGHIGNPKFPLDYDKIIQRAKEKNKLIEINNSSVKSRPGSEENCSKVMELCIRYSVPMVINSDAHVAFDIGKFTFVEELIKKLNVPEELIINTQKSKIISYLKNKGKLSDL